MWQGRVGHSLDTQVVSTDSIHKLLPTRTTGTSPAQAARPPAEFSQSARRPRASTPQGNAEPSRFRAGNRRVYNSGMASPRLTVILVPGVLISWLLGAAASAQVVLPPGFGQPGGQTAPTPAYDLAQQALAEGNFTAALELAVTEYQGGVKLGAQRWIDSIAAAAVVGECRYELGALREAVTAYEEALLVAANHPDWLLAVQFPPQPLRPMAQQRVATWGRSRRNTAPVQLPQTMTIRRGGGDPQEVLQRGGVLAAAADYPIRPHEIVRSLVISLYRHGELLGDLATVSPAVDAATRGLVKRPAPPNHYSQCWIDVALGTAYWVQGKSDLAVPLLDRGLLIGNQLDHPLTAWALLVLGRIALASDRAADAVRLFEEASFSAADFGDARALEEAFRLAFAAHMSAGTRGVPPVIRGGCDWTRNQLPVLHLRLLAMRAQCLSAAGDQRQATAVAKEIDGRLLRADPGRGAAGADAAYAAALIGYAAGDIAAGDGDLDRSLAIAKRRSARLFQTTRLVELLAEGATIITDRQAEAMFSRLLGDPVARDFAVDPLEILSSISTPRTDAFDAWITVAGRRGEEAALFAAEAAARNQWLSSQPLGGRRVSIQRLLGAEPQGLPAADAARRAALLAAHPDVRQLLDDMARHRTTLLQAFAGAAKPAADQPPVLPGAGDDWRGYAQLATRLRQRVAALAAGRDPTIIDFPPLTPTAEIRRRLAPRQLILSFHVTQGGLVGVLESRDRTAFWQVQQAAGLPRAVGDLASSLCLFDPVAAVATDKLVASDWRSAAAQIERILFENSKISLAEGIDELIIVPDGLLWYVPFELLPVASNRQPGEAENAPRLLRDACRIRYAPTRSLAVLRFEAPRLAARTGVHVGRMFRGDKPAVAERTLARLLEEVDGTAALVISPQGPPPALAASLYDTLAIFDELSAPGPVAAWPLVPSSSGQAGFSFDEWLASPRKRPQRVLLPGLQTAMAGGLDKLPARPGDDLFIAVTTLLAAGSHTALVGRWRTGGLVSVDLMAEFLRDLDVPGDAQQPIAERWRRAVDVVTAEQPDPEQEPRLRQVAKAVLPDARHPFFWAGYLLVDCGGGTYSDEPAPPGVPQPKPPLAPPAAKPVNPQPPPPPKPSP